MTLKRYLLTFLLSTGFLGIPSCIFKDCEEFSTYWEITNFELSLEDFQRNEYTNQVYAGDTLSIRFYFKHDFLTQYSIPFIHSTLATSPCRMSGVKGPKDMVTSVEVTSDTTFDEYQPGELLNSLIQGMPIPMLTLEDWINNINSSGALHSSAIFFAYKPEQQHERTFTVKLIFESGKEIAVTTEPITW